MPTPTNIITVYNDGSVVVTPSAPPVPAPTPALPSLSAFTAANAPNPSARCISSPCGAAVLVSPNVAISTHHQWSGNPYPSDTFGTWWNSSVFKFLGTDGQTYTATPSGCIVIGLNGLPVVNKCTQCDLIVWCFATPLPAVVKPWDLPPTTLPSYLPIGSTAYMLLPTGLVQKGPITSYARPNGFTGYAQLGGIVLPTNPFPSGSPVGVPYNAGSMLIYTEARTDASGPGAAYWQAAILKAIQELTANGCTPQMPRISDLSGYGHN